MTESEKHLLQNFLSIQTVNDLALFLEVPDKVLQMHITHKYSDQYKHFDVVKKNGNKRTIIAPCESLKNLQEKLLNVLYLVHRPSSFSHGFEIKKSIETNAAVHTKRKYVFNIDLKDFFPTIHFGRIRGVFMAKPFCFNGKVAQAIANLCCYDGKLPQGAPTSPLLSNFICKGLDRELRSLAKKNMSAYSRYADDITFSTHLRKIPREIVQSFPANQGNVVYGPSHELEAIIKKHGFSVNPEKTRLLTNNDSQVVTGLVTNQFVNVKRKYIKSIRAAIYNIKNSSLQRQEEIYKSKYSSARHSGSLIAHLRGRIDFVGKVRGRDDSIYLNLASKLEDAASGAFSRGETLRITKSLREPHEKIDRSLWVIWSEDTGDESNCCVQGTGFELEGVDGIVTCYHNIGSMSEGGEHYKNLVAFRHNKPTIKYSVSIDYFSKHHDIAVLGIDDNLENKLHSKVSLPERSDKVIVAGFPSYNEDPSTTPFLGHSRIVQTRVSSTRNLLSLDRGIISGTSGGPILDSKTLEVCGIVLKGGETHGQAEMNSENGGICIHHLFEDVLK